MADDPALSASTASALAEFLAERAAAAERADDGCPLAEDWSKSQFWYTADTAAAAADAVVGAVGKGGRGPSVPRVACVACPSLFHALRTRHGDAVDAILLEHDDRLAELGPYAAYDYNEPLALPAGWAASADAVVADPPYLAASCLAKTAESVHALKKGDDAVVLLLTGAVMRRDARRLLGVTPAAFRPEHRSKLGNEFMAATNSEAVAEALGGWDDAWRRELDEE